MDVYVPCDRCGMRAAETWATPDGRLILAFCMHHSRALEVGLYQAGFRLQVTTKMIPV